MLIIFRESLDCNNVFSGYFFKSFSTGADSLSIDVDCTGAAVLNAAAVFGAGELEMLSENPEKWSCWIYIQLVGLAVYSQFDHTSSFGICPKADKN
jgi:hypothetical protein